MLGKTHDLGGVTAALGGYLILHNQGIELPNVNPLIQLAVIYPFARYGSTWSDMDHHWGSVPSKDPFSWMVHKILHLTKFPRDKMRAAGKRKGFVYHTLGIFDARHRSWQTHSYATLIALAGVLWYTCYSEWTIFRGTEGAIVTLVLTGLILGTIAHIFLDGITPEGIWVLSFKLINMVTGKHFLPEKIGLVPHKPIYVRRNGERVSFFATGGPWESFVYRVMKIGSYVMLFIIIYLALPWRIEFVSPFI